MFNGDSFLWNDERVLEMGGGDSYPIFVTVLNAT